MRKTAFALAKADSLTPVRLYVHWKPNREKRNETDSCEKNLLEYLILKVFPYKYMGMKATSFQQETISSASDRNIWGGQISELINQKVF